MQNWGDSGGSWLTARAPFLLLFCCNIMFLCYYVFEGQLRRSLTGARGKEIAEIEIGVRRAKPKGFKVWIREKNGRTT